MRPRLFVLNARFLIIPFFRNLVESDRCLRIPYIPLFLQIKVIGMALLQIIGTYNVFTTKIYNSAYLIFCLISDVRFFNIFPFHPVISGSLRCKSPVIVSALQHLLCS